MKAPSSSSLNQGRYDPMRSVLRNAAERRRARLRGGIDAQIESKLVPLYGIPRDLCADNCSTNLGRDELLAIFRARGQQPGDAKTNAQLCGRMCDWDEFVTRRARVATPDVLMEPDILTGALLEPETPSVSPIEPTPTPSPLSVATTTPELDALLESTTPGLEPTPLSEPPSPVYPRPAATNGRALPLTSVYGGMGLGEVRSVADEEERLEQEEQRRKLLSFLEPVRAPTVEEGKGPLTATSLLPAARRAQEEEETKREVQAALEEFRRSQMRNYMAAAEARAAANAEATTREVLEAAQQARLAELETMREAQREANRALSRAQLEKAQRNANRQAAYAAHLAAAYGSRNRPAGS